MPRMQVCLLLLALLMGIYLDRLTVDASPEMCEHERLESRGGRKCSKRCYDDKDCVSSKKKCMCDGECGRSCVNPNLRCHPVPVDIPHGKVDIMPYNRFAAIASYSCNDGYTLVGLPARICQGDETWKGQPPRCELNHGILGDKNQECGPPPVAHHATHNGQPGQTRYQLGTNLRYVCQPGFTQHKDSVDRAWCVGGGVWVGPNMTCATSGCSIPPDIENGYVEMQSQNMLGGRVRYTCRQGFFLVGNRERKCLKDGQWDGREPSCAKIVCGPPPHVEHAEHDAAPDQYSFTTGTRLTYTCQFGYYREGGERAVCSGPEGQWIGPTMSCKARDCGAPGEINNGWRDPGYRFTYPTRVTYHCNEGYELRGRPYRECQANGEWSGVLPECEPIHCTELGPPLHGTMIGSGTTYGSVIRFVCNTGYKVVGSPERSCQADRTWSGQEAVCEEINCGLPGPLWNGYLDGHRTTVGAVYFYRCNVRTKFNGTSFSTQCLENGQWSQPIPNCFGQCQVPSIVNGTIRNGREGVWVDHATVIQPHCLNGRVLNDSRPVSCNNGSWTIIPQCVPAPCYNPPPQIENGHRVFFSLAHGARARYFCIAGQKLMDGHRYMTCKYGKWTGARPSCEENLCSNPGALTNGEIFKMGSKGKFPFKSYMVTIKHGERLTYECHRNHKLVGPRGAACINGHWSPSERPKCVKSRHPVFNKLWRPFEERGTGRLHY